MLFSVLPDVAQGNRAAQRRGNPIVDRDQLVRLSLRTASANVSDLCFSQLGTVNRFSSRDRVGLCAGVMPFASGHSLGVQPCSVSVSDGTSAFGPHVGHVVFVGAKPEVTETWTENTVNFIDAQCVVSDAGRGIAGVTDLEPARDRTSACFFPCETMRRSPLAARDDEAVAHRSSAASGAEPTGFCAGDLPPEALREGWSIPAGAFGSVLAGGRTEIASLGPVAIRCSARVQGSAPIAQQGYCGAKPGRLGLHQDFPPGVVPRSVSTTAGAFAFPNYTPASAVVSFACRAKVAV